MSWFGGSNNVVKDRAEEVKEKVESHLPSFSGSSSKASNIADKFSGSSGAEQDRYGGHFSSWLGTDAHARIRAFTEKAKNHQGDGSEVGIYASHMSINQDDIRRVLSRVQRKADKEIFSNGAWMGHDGKALKLATQKGIGAEQDRHGRHFGLDEDTVKQLTDRLAAGVQKVKKSVGA